MMMLIGDALKLVKDLPRNIRLCVTSPPYYKLCSYPGGIGQEATVEEYTSQLVTVFKELYTRLAANGTLVLIIGSTPEGLDVPARMTFLLSEMGYKFQGVLADRHVGRDGKIDEMALVFGLAPHVGDRSPAWGFKEISDYAVANYTAPGDLCVDPFAGVGTLGESAESQGRRFIGIDLLDVCHRE